jgi:AcrR family transcriptional regulator
VTRRSAEQAESVELADRGSAGSRERSDAIRNRAAILLAAGALFDEATDATAVTMDDVAVAAGVGKGTVFRRFGDQAGLLRAVFDARIAALVEKIESGPAPLGPSTPPRRRIPAALVATVEFKVENRQLTRLLERVEQRPAGNLFETPSYRWAHALLCRGLAEVIDPAEAEFSAHALLSLTRIDFIEHFLFDEGHSTDELQRHILDHVERVIGPAAPQAVRTRNRTGRDAKTDSDALQSGE